MNALFPYMAMTDGVVVRVAVAWLPDQSDSQAHIWTWSYHIRLENKRDGAITLLNRHWIIENGEGQIQTVTGPGVVGQQPCIAPGASFDYVSGCRLETPRGTMKGQFGFIDADCIDAEQDLLFFVTIPTFRLESSADMART